MAQYAGYALFLAHPDTPFYEENEDSISRILFDSISARLRTQLTDPSHRSLLESGRSVTIPFNSHEQTSLRKGTPTGPGQSGLVQGTSILVPMHRWLTEGSARQLTNTRTPTQITLPSNNPTPIYEIDPSDLLNNYTLTNNILAMADFKNFQLIVITRRCAALVPKYGPLVVPTGSSNPPIQPSIQNPALRRVDIAASENLENAPEWQAIFMGTSDFHQNTLFYYAPECSNALLKHYSVSQMFLLGTGKVRTAERIGAQPEDVFWFAGDDTVLMSRVLGTLEHPPSALIDEIIDRHNLQSQWLENLILAYIVHLFHNGGFEWGDLDSEYELARLIISNPFEPRYHNIPFATKHVYAILTILLLAGPFNIQRGLFPLYKSRVGAPSIIPAEVFANIMTLFSWGLGLALNRGVGSVYPSYLAYRQLPATEKLFQFYLNAAHAAEHLKLYEEFVDLCLYNANEDTTRGVIDELITRGLLPNPGLYLAWYGVIFEE